VLFRSHHQELAQEIEVRQIVQRRRRTAWKTSDLFGSGSSAFSVEVSLRECLIMTRHFSVDRAIIKSILDWELSLRKFTRRWMTHILSAEEKMRRVTESQSLLTILANLAEKNFQGIITRP
jgi:hypothetical protein